MTLVSFLSHNISAFCLTISQPFVSPYLSFLSHHISSGQIYLIIFNLVIYFLLSHISPNKHLTFYLNLESYVWLHVIYFNEFQMIKYKTLGDKKGIWKHKIRNQIKRITLFWSTTEAHLIIVHHSLTSTPYVHTSSHHLIEYVSSQNNSH